MNAYYRLYIKSILSLAATLIIKSEYEVSAVNKLLVQLGYAVDPDDPRSWKYYLNLSGQYHQRDIDQILELSGGEQSRMQIISLDTEEIIDFTVENLKIHRGTKRQYIYGSKFYNDLLKAYPDQVSLIKGIVNPIDIDTAYAADDHTILFYDKSLVEPTEQKLIPELQNRILRYFVRYYNIDYTLFEPYFYPGLFMVLQARIANWIINIRKAACLTDQAHSYHIRQYLLSFSDVGKEFDYMTLKQKLWLYRNIRYLNLNLGREEILALVTDHILTDRGYNLSGYRVDHDYEDLTINLEPRVVLNRFTLNGIEPAAGDPSKSVGQMLDMELGVARDNPRERDDVETSYNQRVRDSKLVGLKTKVLESNVVDRTDAEPFTLTDVLLNHWIYFSNFDLYASVITVTNPANGDVYKLSMKNAFIFYLYAYNAANNQKFTHLPVLGANRVVRLPVNPTITAPTFAELRKMGSKRQVPDYFIDHILDSQVPINEFVSIESFREACVDIHKNMLHLRDMRHYQGDYKTEGTLHAMIDRCYMDIRIDLGDSMTYDQWFDEKGIDISSMGQVEFAAIANDILQTATGADLGVSLRMRDVHAAMIRIMKALSSYSVQFIAQINDSPIKIVDGKFPKLSLPNIFTDTTFDIENPLPTIIGIKEKTVVDLKATLHQPMLKLHSTTAESFFKIPVSVNIKYLGMADTFHPLENPMPLISVIPDDIVDLSTLEVNDIYGYSPLAPKPLDVLFAPIDSPGYSALTNARRLVLLGL